MTLRITCVPPAAPSGLRFAVATLETVRFVFIIGAINVFTPRRTVYPTAFYFLAQPAWQSLQCISIGNTLFSVPQRNPFIRTSSPAKRSSSEPFRLVNIPHISRIFSLTFYLVFIVWDPLFLNIVSTSVSVFVFS